jgi:hypothetical protein
MFGDFKGKLKDRHVQGPEEILMAFQELWDNITFQELQMGFESSRDRLLWIIEDHGEYIRESHICKSGISWTRKNRGTFSLLFTHAVCHAS